MLHITLPGGVKREFAVGTTLAEMGKDFSDNYDSPLAVGVFDGLEYSLSYQVTEDGEVSHEFRRRDACLCPQHRICL